MSVKGSSQGITLWYDMSVKGSSQGITLWYDMICQLREVLKV